MTIMMKKLLKKYIPHPLLLLLLPEDRLQRKECLLAFSYSPYTLYSNSTADAEVDRRIHC